MTTYPTIYKANKNVLSKLSLLLHYAIMLHQCMKIKRKNKKNKVIVKERKVFFQEREKKRNNNLRRMINKKNKK